MKTICTKSTNESLIKPVAIKTRCRVPVNISLIAFQRLFIQSYDNNDNNNLYFTRD